jgi:hypothetical protein
VTHIDLKERSMKRTIIALLTAMALLLGVGASVASATYFYDAGQGNYHWRVDDKATGLDCAEDNNGGNISTGASDCRSGNH